MLDKLTPKQVKEIKKTRDEWLNRFFSCKNRTDREQATKYINWLYDLAKLEKPMIIFLDSPLGIQYGGNILKKVLGSAQVWDQVRDQVRAQVGDQVRAQVGDQVGAQVRAQVGDQVWDQVGAQVRAQVGDQVWDQVGAQVGDQVRAQVGDQVRAQVWDQVGDQVRAQVRDQVGDQVRAQVRAQVGDQVRAQVGAQVRAQELEAFDTNWYYYGSVHDYGWVAFYEYFNKIGIKLPKDLLEKFNNFAFLLKSNIYEMILLKGICIVSDMPTVIKRDLDNRLHSEDSTAIEFKDGYKLYYYHGIKVTEKIILTPNKLTKEDWSSEKNTEVRRVIQIQMGSTFPKKIGCKLMDKPSKEFRKHNLIGLYAVDLPDDPDKVAHYIRVKDHSTNREFYLRTPSTMDNADESLAWTFSKSAKDYNPQQET